MASSFGGSSTFGGFGDATSPALFDAAPMKQAVRIRDSGEGSRPKLDFGRGPGKTDYVKLPPPVTGFAPSLKDEELSSVIEPPPKDFPTGYVPEPDDMSLGFDVLAQVDGYGILEQILAH
jgi:hypothetical protein